MVVVYLQDLQDYLIVKMFVICGNVMDYKNKLKKEIKRKNMSHVGINPNMWNTISRINPNDGIDNFLHAPRNRPF